MSLGFAFMIEKLHAWLHGAPEAFVFVTCCQNACLVRVEGRSATWVSIGRACRLAEKVSLLLRCTLRLGSRRRCDGTGKREFFLTLFLTVSHVLHGVPHLLICALFDALTNVTL